MMATTGNPSKKKYSFRCWDRSEGGNMAFERSSTFDKVAQQFVQIRKEMQLFKEELAFVLNSTKCHKIEKTNFVSLPCGIMV